MAPGADICGACGKPQPDVQPTRKHESPEPERRQLTVMFCDLVDSTALAHQLDPEDLRQVIRGYQKCASEADRPVRRLRRAVHGRRHAGVFWLSAGP